MKNLPVINKQITSILLNLMVQEDKLTELLKIDMNHSNLIKMKIPKYMEKLSQSDN